MLLPVTLPLLAKLPFSLLTLRVLRSTPLFPVRCVEAVPEREPTVTFPRTDLSGRVIPVPLRITGPRLSAGLREALVQLHPSILLRRCLLQRSLFC